ncbi:MAG: redoxin domain-containing protein [Planctomycetes bacterium]|nr:redoxin domain-containing protein [Planctomycetota bacterium]
MHLAARSPFPFLAASLLSLALAVPLAAQKALLADGAVAPDFVSVDLAGKEVALRDFAGKVVVLDFWATWCGPCLQSLPHVQEVAALQKPNGVVVLAVCTGDTRAKFTDWVQKNAAKYPDVLFACDPHDRGGDTFDERASKKLYHVSGLPTKFVIGKDGKVAMGIVGHEAGDTRLEAGLARAGVPIDAAVAAQGEALAKKLAEEAAREAAEAAANPRPSFFPQLMGYKCGDPLPDLALLGADGQEFALSSLRGNPLVVVAAPAEGQPRQQLQEIAQRYSGYGVKVLAVAILTPRADFAAWAQKGQGKRAFVAGGDPAGAYVPADGAPDPEAQLAHHRRTVLGKLFGEGMYPAMPFSFVLDAGGKVVGSFWLDDQLHEGLANLLLHAGVKLEAKDLPKQVAGPETFVIAPPPPPEAPVALLADGAAAPDFAAQDLAGNTVRLADFAGKVVVLDFWATWCGPCKAALPHVQQVAAKYRDQGVVVLASCTGDARSAFEKFVDKNQADYPDVRFVHDPLEKKPERASRQLYGVSGIPHQFVIGRDGRIAAQVGGYSEGEVLLDAALAKAGVSVDPAILEQAKLDQQKRDARSKQGTVPALPLRGVPAKKMRPGGAGG